MHTYLDRKCFGITSLIAGVILGLIAFGIWKAWLNLTLFFAVMLVLMGIHAIFCNCEPCCETPKEKVKKK